MDKDHRDLVSRLFTLATEILEDAHEPISRGQGSGTPQRNYPALAARLDTVGEDLKAVAGTIRAILRQPVSH